MFKKDWPKYHAGWASVGLQTYESYVKIVSKVLAEEVRRIEREAKKVLKKMPDDEAKFDREREYNDQIVELKHSFPSMCYRTTFVAIYSRLEHELVSWCHKVQSIRRYKISVDDLGSRNIIDRCSVYLTKVADVPFPKKTPEWQDITKLQRIRNKIVHERGNIVKRGQPESEESKELRKYIKSKGGLVSNSGNIALSEAFCFFRLMSFVDSSKSWLT